MSGSANMFIFFTLFLVSAGCYQTIFCEDEMSGFSCTHCRLQAPTVVSAEPDGGWKYGADK